jgi:hypothetical protein
MTRSADLSIVQYVTNGYNDTLTYNLQRGRAGYESIPVCALKVLTTFFLVRRHSLA